MWGALFTVQCTDSAGAEAMTWTADWYDDEGLPGRNIYGSVVVKGLTTTLTNPSTKTLVLIPPSSRCVNGKGSHLSTGALPACVRLISGGYSGFRLGKWALTTARLAPR